MDKLIVHIKKTMPNYEYNRDDIELYDNGDGSPLVISKWNLLIPKPEIGEVSLISQTEVNESAKYITLKHRVDSVSDLKYVLNPEIGNLVLQGGFLKIYNGSVWLNV